MGDFKIGYCVHCGQQALVTDFQNRPINGLVGTKKGWITLQQPDGTLTRVGAVVLCPACEAPAIGPETILQELCDLLGSGVSRETPEIAQAQSIGWEEIQRYGV